jgi:hypothetical protein
MWLLIGILLLFAWIGGFVVYHTAGFLIHILLLAAIISAVMHIFRGSDARA